MGEFLDWNIFWRFSTIALIVCQLTCAVPTKEKRKSYSGYQLLRTKPIVAQELANILLALDGTQGKCTKYILVSEAFLPTFCTFEFLKAPNQDFFYAFESEA